MVAIRYGGSRDLPVSNGERAARGNSAADSAPQPPGQIVSPLRSLSKLPSGIAFELALRQTKVDVRSRLRFQIDIS